MNKTRLLLKNMISANPQWVETLVQASSIVIDGSKVSSRVFSFRISEGNMGMWDRKNEKA